MSIDNNQTNKQNHLLCHDKLKNIAKSSSSHFTSGAFWRFWFIISLVTLVIMIAFGIIVFLVFFGLLMILIRFSVVYQPLGRFFANIAGLPEGKYLFPEVTGPISKKLLVIWPTIIWIGITFYGFWLLFRIGFVNQNFIYLIFFR